MVFDNKSALKRKTLTYAVQRGDDVNHIMGYHCPSEEESEKHKP